jgi:hypothetical protein
VERDETAPLPDDDDEMEALLAEIEQEDQREGIADALGRLGVVEDANLKSYRRDWLGDFAISEEDTRRCRDLIRAMVRAIDGEDAEQWERVRRAHDAAFGGLAAPQPVPEGGSKPHVEDHESPWAKGHPRPAAPLPKDDPLNTTAPVSPAKPQGDALPFAGASATPVPVAEDFEPHPEIGQTVGLDGSGPGELPGTDDLALPLQKYVLAKIDLAESKDTSAVAEKYGLDEAEWEALDSAYAERFASSPALKQRFDELMKKLGSWVE